jgi:nucleotide-binding universal stress UspA family protein
MKVLIATDGSTHAMHAAEFLSRLPHRDPLELTIVTSIVYPNLHPADAVTMWPPEIWEQLRESADEAVERVQRLFDGADATVEKEVLEGHAGQTIVDKAVAIGAELIVLGAKGHSSVERIMLGSVSDYVANHARCGVMVIRPPAGASGPSRLSTTIAYDGSQRSERAIDQFTQFGWGHTTQTHVLTIVPIVRFFGRDVLPDNVLHRDEQLAIASKAVKHAADRLESTHADISTHVVEAAHLGEGIVDFSEQNGGGLIVVGATGFSGISRLLMGSVSQYVLRHAQCSVWIAR